MDRGVSPYHCHNYSSILTPDSSAQMSDLLDREVREGMVSITDSRPTCVHALGAKIKPDGSIRPITDCSRPPGRSVNDSCASLYKTFKYKSVDNLIDMLVPGDFLSVVDIKAAYRAVPVHPSQRQYLGIAWSEQGQCFYFEDNRLCFGLRSGPYYFNLLSCMIHDILRWDYGIEIVNYLDDFATRAPTHEACMYNQNCIIHLLRYLGFHIAWGKLSAPSTTAVYLILGLEIDSESMEIRLPPIKLQKLLSLLDRYRSRRSISKSDLESLAGLLSHCAHVVKGGRIYTRRVYDLYKTMIHKKLRRIKFNAAIREDLQWWFSLCAVFNGKAAIINKTFPVPLVSDSSQTGFGAHLGFDWLAGTWEPHLLDTLSMECGHILSPPISDSFDHANINVLELWPVLCGLKRWGPTLKDSTVVVLCDNTQVCAALRSGNSINKTTMSWLREIFWTCFIFNIEIQVEYISTTDNLVADGLSRLSSDSYRQANAKLFSQIDLCCANTIALYCRARDFPPQGISSSAAMEVCGTCHPPGPPDPMALLHPVLQEIPLEGHPL